MNSVLEPTGRDHSAPLQFTRLTNSSTLQLIVGMQNQKCSNNVSKPTVEMVAECGPSAVARTVLGTVRSPSSGCTCQAITGHVIALLPNLFALAFAVAIGAIMKGVAFGLAV